MWIFWGAASSKCMWFPGGCKGIFEPFLPSVSCVSHGVDTEFFTPSTRADQSGRKLRLGWAGNRASPAKGFEQFIAPLGRLPGVELAFCGFQDRNLSLDDMREHFTIPWTPTFVLPAWKATTIRCWKRRPYSAPLSPQTTARCRSICGMAKVLLLSSASCRTSCKRSLHSGTIRLGAWPWAKGRALLLFGVLTGKTWRNIIGRCFGMR